MKNKDILKTFNVYFPTAFQTLYRFTVSLAMGPNAILLCSYCSEKCTDTGTDSGYILTQSLVSLVPGWPLTKQHEGVCAPSALGFVLRQALISPFVCDTEEHDAEGHGRRRGQ